MNLFSSCTEKISHLRSKLNEGSLGNLIWLVNIVPRLCGFSLLRVKVHPALWIVHIGLLFYIYAVGMSVFLIFHARGTVEFIQSYVNISLFIMICNNTYWFLSKRAMVKDVMELVKENDKLVSKKFEEKRRKLLKTIMVILIVFYTFTYIEEFGIYTPSRADIKNTYGMSPCVGLEPLTQTPNLQICIFMLITIEVTVNIVCLNYQTLLCLLIAHTAAMYQILCDEINQLNEIDDEGNIIEYAENEVVDRKEYVKERLENFITRHCLILNTIQKLKDLYSMPIGINFMTNAFCIMLFFFLTFDEYIAFCGVLVYCSVVFFLYCFLCQKLINASEDFERAVYNCGWENFELAEKQKIYNILVSAQRPVELLAAYIIPVNIATFATTCQAMYKFVTIVKF